MTKDLNWEQLPDRRQKHRLSMLYKIQNKIVDVDASDIYSLLMSSVDVPCRTSILNNWSCKRDICCVSDTSNVYKFSFYPRTIHEWNPLPFGVTESPTIEAFQTVLSVFTVFRLLTDFVCLYTYEFGLSLCKIVRSSRAWRVGVCASYLVAVPNWGLLSSASRSLVFYLCSCCRRIGQIFFAPGIVY
jgi:hypothetical protein